MRPASAGWGGFDAFRTRGEMPGGGVGGTEVRGHAAWSRLLLGGLEVGVGSRGVVGDVNYVNDFWHGLGDRDLDALAEGDRGHAASLTAAAEAQVGGPALDAGELGVPSVGSDVRGSRRGPARPLPGERARCPGSPAGGSRRGRRGARGSRRRATCSWAEWAGPREQAACCGLMTLKPLRSGVSLQSIVAPRNFSMLSPATTIDEVVPSC